MQMVARSLILRFAGLIAMPPAQTRGLIKQVLKVDDYAGTEDINGVVAKDAGRQQIQDELTLIIYHGVACVVAALIADNDVVIFPRADRPCGPLPSSPQFVPTIAVNIVTLLLHIYTCLDAEIFFCLRR